MFARLAAEGGELLDLRPRRAVRGKIRGERLVFLQRERLPKGFRRVVREERGPLSWTICHGIPVI